MSKKKYRSQEWFNNLENQTPWQEISRNLTVQLSEGACLNLQEDYTDIANSKGIPRDSH